MGPISRTRPMLAVLGVGLIGRRHVQVMRDNDLACPAMIVDPSEDGRAFARTNGAAWYPDLDSLLANDRPDGILIATPTQLHMQATLQCIDAGVPVLVEKPITATLDQASRVCERARTLGVPVLVGHHRRHNPIIKAAKQAIDDGRIGRVVAVNAMVWLAKPDDYFAPDWRRQPGAGPILTNLIHDIDLMRHLCGDVATVQALTSSAVRGHAVEDTGAILLRFQSGALGTLSVSDAIQAPWSWELTAAENPVYAATGQACYQIGGTNGSLELPTLRLWQHGDAGHWYCPMTPTPIDHQPLDPLAAQIAHFADVIAGIAEPLVTAQDGLRAIEVVEAVATAIRTGETVDLRDLQTTA